MESSKKISILVVDDEKDQRRFLKEFFEYEGYIVYTAEDGEEARRLLKEEDPDILIQDMKLNKTTYRDGVEFPEGLIILEEIRKTHPHKKVIMVTAVNDDETIEKTQKLGANEYITKPIDMEYLCEVIKRLATDIRIENIDAKKNPDN